MTNKKRRKFLGAFLAPMLGAALAIAGCSGSFHDDFFNGDSGVFYAADQSVGNGVGRNYVELKNGIPVRLGMELTPAALAGLPVVAPDQLVTPYLAPFPSKVHGTPFTNVVLGYASSHPATSEPAHFHVLFLIRNFQPTSPPFTLELAPPLIVEVPLGLVRVTDAANPFGVIVPGAGTIYDDPTQPVGLPAATTLGQNLFYFGAHLNGVGLGPTIAFLQSKQSETKVIKQPEFYPKDGFYPHKWTVRFDAVRQTHIIELIDFQRATKFLPPGN